jgi:hypothetical protein
MSKRSIWDSDAQMEQALCTVFRYGMLIFILGLFAFAILGYLYCPPGRDPYRGFISPFIWLFGYLAFTFKWRRPVAVALYVLLTGSMAFGLFYDLHLSHVLFPRQ